jgi:uncharacterized membrane protein
MVDIASVSGLETRVEQPVFAAVITPHRSLGKNAFRLVMTLICIATIISSLPFVILGAWPVAGFFGLDLVALYVAFRINFRQAKAFEEIIVTRIDVTLRKVTHSGEITEWRSNPAWTKLERVEDEDYGTLGLALVSRGNSISIAQALSPPERESFAKSLTHALFEARR